MSFTRIRYFHLFCASDTDFYQNKRETQVHVDKKLTLSNWADLWYRDYQSQVQVSTDDEEEVELLQKNLRHVLLEKRVFLSAQ